MKTFFTILITASVLIPSTVRSQCIMNDFYIESFEYTTPIPGLLPNKVYHVTPQTTSLAEAVYSGNYGMYMNIQDGQMGVIYSNPINDLCIGSTYEFSFAYRNATSVLPNPNFVVRLYDQSGTLISAVTLTASNTWQIQTFPSFTATTTAVTVEIESLIPGGPGNDLGIDDLTLKICTNSLQSKQLTLCTATPAVNLFDEIDSPALSSLGTWTGGLSNGHLGTFTPGVTTPGSYSYYIGPDPSCADSVATITVSVINEPEIDPISDVTSCNTYVLPSISGNHLSSTQLYYTGSGATGTSYAPGTAINSSQILYAYSGGSGCYDEQSFSVTIVPNPVISATPNDTICAGEFTSIIASSSTPNLVYTWNPGNIQSSELAVSPASTMFYSVTATDAHGCVSNLISRLVVVRPAPTVTITASDNQLCFGDSVTLTANASVQSVSYNWLPNGETTSQISDIPITSTQYVVAVTNQQGCSGTDTTVITVIPELGLTFSGNTIICTGDTTMLTVSGNIPQMQFVWEGSVSGATYNANPTQTGYIYATGSYQDCPQVTDSLMITVNPLPVVIAPESIQLCRGEAFNVTASAVPSASTIYWSSPAGATGGEQTIVAINAELIHVYAEHMGCISESDSFYVDVLLSCGIEIPNVFTPNKDGINDGFTLISSDGIEQLTAVILNRWGTVVRTFNQPDFSWDGRDEQGNDMMEGVYFYLITGTFLGGESFEKQGFVSIER